MAAGDVTKCFMVTVEDGDFRRVDSGERIDGAPPLPPGAMWEAPQMGDAFRTNGDGPVLVVALPNGAEWMPGSVASNCDRRGEDHDCWCVHGEAPNVTADKTPEPGRSTCSAGAGSIGSQAGTPSYWHGFLTDGELREV